MNLLKKFATFIGWIVLGFVGLFLILLFIGVVGAFSGGISDADLSGLKVETDHGVGVIELSGEIISSNKVRKFLKKALDHEKIKAIVVRIDSPGGSVGVSEEIYREIKYADGKKPTICALGNTAASGGLYAAMGCRKVVTNEGTLTGSIGVIMMMPNFTSIAERFGLGMNVIKSGRFKDSGSPFRKLEKEDKDLLQAMVDKAYEQFLKIVSDSRKLPAEEVRKFADGRIILGEEAVELGLADEIGGVRRAAKLALEATGDTAEPELVQIKKPSGLLAILDELQGSEARNWIGSFTSVRLLYQAYY